MGDKKKKKSSGVHANQSFAELVGQKNQEALKPFVIQYIHQIVTPFARNLKAEQDRNLLRIFNLEKIIMDKLGILEETLIEGVTDLEDQAKGLVKVIDDVVKVGDFLRIELAAKSVEEEKFGEFSRYEVRDVVRTPTFSENLENNMLGMKPGDEKEVTELGQDGKTMVNIKVRVNRISRTPKKEEPKKEEAAK